MDSIAAAVSWPIPRWIPRSVPYHSNNGSPETTSGETGPDGYGTWCLSAFPTRLLEPGLVIQIHHHHQHAVDPGKTLSLRGQQYQLLCLCSQSETNVIGTTWASGPTPGVSVPISQFYIAQPGTDNAGSINAALNSGLNLILAPGIYHLTNSILVTNPDTIVLGLGFPTLVPTNGNPAMVISDVDGVKVADILFDAGTTASPALLEVGPPGSSLDHSADPNLPL